MSKQKTYCEITVFKGDLNQDGAVLRMNEMRILMKTAAEMDRNLQYQESENSYALFGPTDLIHEGAEAAAKFRKLALAKVDVCGMFGDAEREMKVMTLVKLAEEKECVCGGDLILSRAKEMAMEPVLSCREWKV